jgi:glycerophosphoryl diester phosphodiesterase
MEFDALQGEKLRLMISAITPLARPMYSAHPLPFAISHRGLRHTAPENTIPAFLAAIDAGAGAIELDVHATFDGVVIVHHDDSVQAAAGDPSCLRRFSEMVSSDVAKLRLRGDVAIPTLDETLAAIGAHASVFIEIKARGIESDVVRCLRRHAEGLERYAVHAFDHRISKRMLELLPSLRTGVLQVGYPIDSCRAMRAAGGSDLWQQVDFVDPALVQDVHSCAGRVIVWTANSESQWRSLADAGVDGICTDRVDEYVAWAARQSTAGAG